MLSRMRLGIPYEYTGIDEFQAGSRVRSQGPMPKPEISHIL
jgi:hypothetical protein